MNLRSLKKRVDSLEKAAGVGVMPIKVAIRKPGQTNADALAEAGIDPDDNSLTIIVVKFCDPKQPGLPLYEKLIEAGELKPTLSEIDAEISRREANPGELYQQVPKEKPGIRDTSEGVDVLTKAQKIGKAPQRISETERIARNPETESQSLDPQPMRLDDLTRLTR